MLNESFYIQHADSVRMKQSWSAQTKIVSDITKIKDFEEKSGVLIGTIPNIPYYNINLDLYEDTISKRLFRYCNIEYEKNGAAVLPVCHFGNDELFLLEHHYRVFTQRYHWEVPRGFADLNDLSAKSTALRELAEETGITDAMHPELLSLGTVFPDTGLSNAEVSLYAAIIELPSISVVQNHDATEEIVGYRLFSLEELQKMIMKNDISDGFTLAAILRYVIKKASSG